MLADTALKHADYETAIREFEVLVVLEAADPAGAYTNLAEAFLLAGNREAAKQRALAALEIAPTYERAQNILLNALEP
jgi:hypothetical protein